MSPGYKLQELVRQWLSMDPVCCLLVAWDITYGFSRILSLEQKYKIYGIIINMTNWISVWGIPPSSVIKEDTKRPSQRIDFGTAGSSPSIILYSQPWAASLYRTTGENGSRLESHQWFVVVYEILWCSYLLLDLVIIQTSQVCKRESQRWETRIENA